MLLPANRHRLFLLIVFIGSRYTKAQLQAVVAQYEGYNKQKLDDLKKECVTRGMLSS